MPQGLSYSQLPVSPLQPNQPLSLSGGPQEQNMQRVMQMLVQRASDPNMRRQMAQQLARQLPPPPDNIFGRGMPTPRVGMPQQRQVNSEIPDFSGLGAFIQPQQQVPMNTPPAGLFAPGGNNQAAITAYPTNGMQAFGQQNLTTVPGFDLVPR